MLLFYKNDKIASNLEQGYTVKVAFLLALSIYVICIHYFLCTFGCAAQSVTCLATDGSQNADPGVASSIPAPSHTLLEIDHEIRTFSSFPLNHSRRVVVSYKRKYVQEVLVNCLFKLAQEKVWLGELTVPP